jgi:hypothetical protein
LVVEDIQRNSKDSGQTEAIFDQDEDALDALPDEDFTYQ